MNAASPEPAGKRMYAYEVLEILDLEEAKRIRVGNVIGTEWLLGGNVYQLYNPETDEIGDFLKVRRRRPLDELITALTQNRGNPEIYGSLMADFRAKCKELKVGDHRRKKDGVTQ